MKIVIEKGFGKQYKKLLPAKKYKVDQAILLFSRLPMDSSLRNHALRGRWAGHRSISAGGDLRLHYISHGEQTAVFVAVGSHNQLYG